MKRTSAILNSMFWSLMSAALFASAPVQPVVTELEFPTYGFSDPDPPYDTKSPSSFKGENGKVSGQKYLGLSR